MADVGSLLHLGQKPSPRESCGMLPSLPQKTRRRFLAYSLRSAIVAALSPFLVPLLSSRAIAAAMQEGAKLAPQAASAVDPQKEAAFEKEIADIRTALIQRYAPNFSSYFYGGDSKLEQKAERDYAKAQRWAARHPAQAAAGGASASSTKPTTVGLVGTHLEVLSISIAGMFAHGPAGLTQAAFPPACCPSCF